MVDSDLLDETKEVETEDEPARITAFPAPESSPSRPSQENMYERSSQFFRLLYSPAVVLTFVHRRFKACDDVQQLQ